VLSNSVAHDEFRVQVKQLPEQRLAYIRVYDSYRRLKQLLAAYERLLAWFDDCGGRIQDVALYGISQDDPDITPLRLCRFDWCIQVPATWQTPDDISATTLPACKVAMVRCVGGLALEEMAFRHLFCEWLPNSSYQPANLPAMEIYRQLPSDSGWLSFDMDCAVPIETL
jgi:AraC family transcriptional regulator